MTRDAWVLGLSGACFGVLIGWIIGSQASRPGAPAVSPAPAPQVQGQGRAQSSGAVPGQAQGQPGAPSQGSSPQQAPSPIPLDEAQVKTLTEQASQRPKDAQVRAQLGNLYFDAERYPEAITWYEASLAAVPRNANVSTDLAVSYYYTNQTDRALRQFDVSLQIDPKHTKTMLNLGMVKAFGKQDLAGAAAAWQKVVELAPDSAEGRAARQALESLKAAHPDTGPGTGASSGTGDASAGAAAPPSPADGAARGRT